jgi:hypothetical protein
MSYPFIIWTMQRTGGTSLTELLMALSEHRSADHEPFNFGRDPRQFAEVARAFSETGDAPALRQALSRIFAGRYLIKHCYEFHAPPFNRELLNGSVPTPYRHIHLLRRDEMSRLVSKFIAQSNGTWFKDYARSVYSQIRSGERKLPPLPVPQMVKQYQQARQFADNMRQRLRGAGVPMLALDYEDLFMGETEERLRNLAALLQFLDFDPAIIERQRELIDDKIFNSGQDTAAVAEFVPNYRAVVAALAAAGCPGAA